MNKKWNIDPFSGYKGSIEWLEKRTIFASVHGSQAYGTATPESDIDIKGLAIPPKEYFFSFQKKFEQAESNKPYDMVVFDLRKFMKLAADCNPNIIEILFTDPEDWIFSTSLYEKLWSNRELFLSTKARFTFSGYANSQLKRIKGHKRWLMNPPTHKPTRQEFGLPENKKMSSAEIGATQKLADMDVPVAENVILLLQKEQAYQNALREWNQYENWKKTRNKKRAEIEAKFGFDLKHATHLVRLMRMCEEILSTGNVLVKRPDAHELMEIRQGAWTYEQLIDWADKKDKQIESIYFKSPLPKKPKYNEIDILCQELIEEALKHDTLRF